MTNLRFYLLFLKEWSELFVEFLTIGETTVDEAYAIYFGTDAEFLIRKTINVLKELILIIIYVKVAILIVKHVKGKLCQVIQIVNHVNHNIK